MDLKNVTSVRLAASTLVYRGEVKVWAVGVLGLSAAGYIQIYDGLNTTGDVIWIHGAVDTGMDSIAFTKPLVLRKGMYIAFSTTNIRANIQYEPVHPDELR